MFSRFRKPDDFLWPEKMALRLALAVSTVSIFVVVWARAHFELILWAALIFCFSGPIYVLANFKDFEQKAWSDEHAPYRFILVVWGQVAFLSFVSVLVGWLLISPPLGDL